MSWTRNHSENEKIIWNGQKLIIKIRDVSVAVLTGKLRVPKTCFQGEKRLKRSCLNKYLKRQEKQQQQSELKKNGRERKKRKREILKNKMENKKNSEDPQSIKLVFQIHNKIAKSLIWLIKITERSIKNEKLISLQCLPALKKKKNVLWTPVSSSKFKISVEMDKLLEEIKPTRKSKNFK